MAGKKKPGWIYDDIFGPKERDKRYKNPMNGVIAKDLGKHKREKSK